MKSNNTYTEYTNFTLTSLLPDWRSFKTAVEDLRDKDLANISIEHLTVWKQEPEHTVTAELLASNADYVQIIQRLLGSQSNGELESVTVRVTDGTPSNAPDDAGLTMTSTPEHTEQSESGHHNEDKVIYGGWN